MAKQILFALLISLSFIATAQEKIDFSKLGSEDFLATSRKSLLAYSWVKLPGKIIARPTEGDLIKLPIECSAQLIPNKITFQSIIDKKQNFQTSIQFGKGKAHSTKILKDYQGEDNFYKKVDIKATDLSLAFMYWDLVNELEPERLGLSAHKCRVFRLSNPDADEEYARVWLSQEYLAPVKVEWRRGKISGDADQLLEFKKFAEVNKVWVPTEIYLKNKTARIQVRFDKEKINANFSKTLPKDFFLK